MEALGPISLPVKAAGDAGKLFTGDRERHRRGHQEGRRPEPGQADRPAAQAHIKATGTHTVGVHLHPMWRSM